MTPGPYACIFLAVLWSGVALTHCPAAAQDSRGGSLSGSAPAESGETAGIDSQGDRVRSRDVAAGRRGENPATSNPRGATSRPVSPEAGRGGNSRPLSTDQWGPTEQLWAARVCWAEGSDSEPDCIAVLDTITNRWQLTHRGKYRDPVTQQLRPWRWLDMLREYASVADPTPRGLTDTQREIRAFPWGDIPGKPGWVNDKWLSLRQLVLSWGRGEIGGQCAGVHWGGLRIARDRLRADRAVKSGRWRVVDCGRTHNTFFTRGRR